MPFTTTESAIQAIIEYFSQPPINLSAEDVLFDAMRKDSTIIHIETGHVLCRLGERAGDFWWLLQGEIEATIPDDEGRPITVGRVASGNLLGESSLFRGEEAFRNATLTSTTPAVLLQVPMLGHVKKALVKSQITKYF